MHRKLVRITENVAAQDLKPSPSEKVALAKIVNNPDRVIDRESRDLIVKYRYSLLDNKRVSRLSIVVKGKSSQTLSSMLNRP